MEGTNEYLAESGFRFNQSTAHYYAQIEEDDPALFEQIRAKVKAGGWETVGGMWVEPDTNMPTGESLIAPGALRTALFRAEVRRPPHGLLAARLLRLLGGAAADPEAGRHRPRSSPSR